MVLDDHHRTPLSYAASANQVEMIYFLKEKNAELDLSPQYRSPLHYAAGSGHIESAKVLIEVGANVDSHSREVFCDVTPIMLATINNHLSIVQFLLAHGAEGVLKCREIDLVKACEEQVDKNSCHKIQNNIELHNYQPDQYKSCYFETQYKNVDDCLNNLFNDMTHNSQLDSVPKIGEQHQAYEAEL